MHGVCSIMRTMLARSWGEWNECLASRTGDGGYLAVVHRCRVERGVQSISRKSVCTARSPNAATLSSYSFDRNPLGLCTQSLMALFKDRYRSITKPPLLLSFHRGERGIFFASDSPASPVFLLERERERERALNRLRDNRRRVARRRIRIYIYIYRCLAPSGARSRWQRQQIRNPDYGGSA